MSDLLATSNTLVAPSDGQAQQASGQAQNGTDSQPSNGQVDTAQDNIRKLQSTYDKQIAALKSQVQQSNQYISQVTQQMRQAEKNAAPDDFARMEIDLRHEREEKAAMAQQLAQIQQERAEANARTDAFQKIATRFGVAVEDIEKANPGDYETAVEAAIAARDKRKQNKQEQDDDKRERNAPDLGSSAPRTPTTAWERDYEDARRRKDSPAMARLLREKG